MEIVFIVELSIGFLFWPSFSVVSFALPQPSCLVFAIRKQSENPCCQVQMHLIFKVQLVGFFPLYDEFYTEAAAWYLSNMASSAKSSERSILTRRYRCCHCEFHHCQTFWAKTAQFSAFMYKGADRHKRETLHFSRCTAERSRCTYNNADTLQERCSISRIFNIV